MKKRFNDSSATVRSNLLQPGPRFLTFLHIGPSEMALHFPSPLFAVRVTSSTDESQSKDEGETNESIVDVPERVFRLRPLRLRDVGCACGRG